MAEQKGKSFDDACVVKNVDGQQLVFMPNGDKIPYVRMTRVTDKCNELTRALIEVIVKLK